MAVLTASGITFSDGTSVNSKYQIFPQGVSGAPSRNAVIFYQANAPTGWTKQTAVNDRALRVVSGTSGNAGGNQTFSSTMATRPLSANVPVSISGLAGQSATLDANSIPSHTHPAFAGGNVQSASGGPARVQNGGGTGNTGNSGGHTHSVNANAANGPINTNVDFNITYIDVIYCTFN